MPPTLEVQDVVVAYGRVQALHGVSLTVNPGEVVAVIGRNGAGKSTLLKTVFGFLRPTSGSIRFEDVDLTTLQPHQMAQLGIGYVPEDRGVFTELTVLENLQLGAIRAREHEDDRIGEVFALFPQLAERSGAPAATLSGGQQQMLALGRALMISPRLLLLDEPSLGLAPRILDSLFETLAELATRGLSIVLVEQNVKRSLAIASRAYLLNLGRVELEGTAASVAKDPALQTVYMAARASRRVGART